MPLTRPRTALLSDVDGFLNVVGMIKPHSGSSAPTGWLNCDGSSILRASFATLFALIGTAFGSVDGTHFNVPDLRGRTPIGSGQGTFTSSFLNTAVATGSEQITVTANEHFVTGQKVRITSTGTLPSPLLVATDYYIVVVNTTTISLAASLANAQNSTPLIDLTTQGTGTHTLTWQNYTNRAIGVIGGEEIHAMSINEIVAHAHATQKVFSPAAGATGILETGSGTTGATDTQFMSNAGGNVAMNVLQPFVALNWIIKT